MEYWMDAFRTQHSNTPVLQPPILLAVFWSDRLSRRKPAERLPHGGPLT